VLQRAYPWALGEELFAESKKNSVKIKTLGEEILRREQKKLSVKNSSSRAVRQALGEEILHREFFLLSAK
jgi:hypothetical protein